MSGEWLNAIKLFPIKPALRKFKASGGKNLIKEVQNEKLKF